MTTVQNEQHPFPEAPPNETGLERACLVKHDAESMVVARPPVTRSLLASGQPAQSSPVEGWRATNIRRLHGPGFEVGESYEQSLLQQVQSQTWRNRTSSEWVPPTQVIRYDWLSSILLRS